MNPRVLFAAAAAAAAIVFACSEYKEPVAPDLTARSGAHAALIEEWLGDYDDTEPITDETDAYVGTFDGVFSILALIETAPGEYLATGALNGTGTADDGSTWPIVESFDVAMAEENSGGVSALRAKKPGINEHCPPGLALGHDTHPCFITPVANGGKKKKK